MNKTHVLAIFPSVNSPTISVANFESLKIAKYLLTDSRASKMVDNLPLSLFKLKNIKKALDLHDFSMVYILLPWTFFRYAVLDPTLTRNERIDLLSLVFTFLLVYKIGLINYFEAKKRVNPDIINQFKQNQNRVLSSNIITLYDFQTLDKALSLIYFLLNELSNNEDLHLGALSTHFLEDFFGMMRHFDLGDDRCCRFIQSVMKAVMMSDLKKKLNISVHISSRVSDSGATVLIEENLCLEPFGKYLSVVVNFFQQELKNWFFTQSEIEMFEISRDMYPDVPTIEDYINYLIERINEKDQKTISTITELMNLTGGLSNMKYYESKAALLRLWRDENFVTTSFVPPIW
jgi:hypothetical protein